MGLIFGKKIVKVVPVNTSVTIFIFKSHADLKVNVVILTVQLC